MTSTVFTEIKEELKKGITEYGHPFRFFTLGTVGLDKMARLRTVVLRDFSEEWDLSFFTDKRSKKVTHIIENPKVCILLYHPEKRIQLKIEGNAFVVKNDKKIAKYWNRIKDDAKNDYTTTLAPGSNINSLTEIEYLNEGNHFCLITIEAHKIEYLRLDKPNHIKIRYSKDDNHWKGEFLVP
ncbi:pyridoxamine 5'-phosphate oxidase family protein [Cellulophaga sp. E16_2]|uniref:pyridoxamine 5'-phosphate oxidase family protein n=1 Tax=unclassified Cellulophaga TaxID=2634405 RepID=UPI0013FD5BD9|nr:MULTISPECIES: pyridoxamine 5'-phosphate oxidase family protein [unclassified Cellulophaga]MBO0592293.1 pyridoxamine 5'-phosphate oxidase family protein [Cellulophaga sp. E16_2]